MRFSAPIVYCAALLAAGLPLAWSPAVAQSCLLCGADGTTGTPSLDPQSADEPTLRVEIVADLDFARLVSGVSGGSITLDPGSAGAVVMGDVRTVSGMGFQGRIHIEGVAGAMVRITLPDEVLLTSTNGGQARVTDISVGQSPVVRLGPDGRLDLAFGGQLQVTGRVDGEFRGRIPVTVSYE